MQKPLEKLNLPEVESDLIIQSLRENNFKNIDFKILHDSINVICGPSGSGKSTLAFDTIYAEGGRRYIETFSPYTRQFLDRLKAPDCDGFKNVRPSLGLEQRNRLTSSRSTVGTLTDINDYLKIFWSQNASLQCPDCKIPVERHLPDKVAEEIFNNHSSNYTHCIITFDLPRSSNTPSSLASIAEMLQSQGFQRFILMNKDMEIYRIEELSKKIGESELIRVVVDRITIDSEDEEDTKNRISSSIRQAYDFSSGYCGVVLLSENNFEYKNYNNLLQCNSCSKKFSQPTPSLFSFNSPIGACKECQGFGKVLKVDKVKCIPDVNKSIKDGAVHCWEGDGARREKKSLFLFCESEDIPLDNPWSKLSEKQKEKIFYGSSILNKDKEKKTNVKYKGIFQWFEKLYGKRHKMHVRVFLSRFRSEFICPSCNGSRLNNEALSYLIEKLSIQDLWTLPVSKSYEFISAIKAPRESEEVHKEICSRLNYLIKVGLPYLTLDRQAKTLSGGEFQRVNLTTILGTNLVNTTLVLDEPTIGLHPRDTESLIQTMRDLQEKGNSLVVVEHDPDVISSADRIYEIGPDAGSYGGMMVFEGTPEDLLNYDTKTSRYFKNLEKNENLSLKKISKDDAEKEEKFKANSFIRIENACANNLKNITVKIPKGKFSVLSGVSGSGKSTLIDNCLYEVVKDKELSKKINGDYSTISGLEDYFEVVMIDQQPIGKTSRANPATYTKAWDVFRDYFSETEEAIRLGLTKSAFSFNVDGGRCPVCKGNGEIKVEMQFLTDVYIGCEVCNGMRFQDQVLTVKLGTKNVFEWMKSSIFDAWNLVDSLPDKQKNEKIRSLLSPLCDLGLGYLPLGHPLSALSGGEAQRLKLASYISGKTKGKSLIILDEPSTGLHPSDIELLISCIRSLLKNNHTVLCVEHNLDIIRASDWLIEIGPDGGEGGGELLLEGVTKELLNKSSITTPTLLHLRKKFTLNSNKKELKKNTDSKDIIISGAREHNLKNVSVRIPENSLTVVSGVSGSGKSTLVFDILFSEGQRRFIDCLSPYARQYIKQTNRPEVDQVSGLSPTIAVSQKTAPSNGVSTLGTVTEVYQYLRLLFSKVGTQYCVKDGTLVEDFSPERLLEAILEKYTGKKIYIFSPVVSGRKGHYNELFQRAHNAEITHARVDGKYISISDETKLKRHNLHWISLLVAQLNINKNNRSLISEALSQALVLSGGSIEIALDPHDEPEIFSTSRVCPKCKTGYMPLDPQDFSFRSLRGMCHSCGGRGYVTGVNEWDKKVCSECSGSRLSKIGRNVKVFNKTIHELSLITAPLLRLFFEKNKFSKRLAPVTEPLIHELIGILDLIEKIGLGYLSLDRDASTLSGGEAQRLRLAKSFGAPLSGVCYVLDEPSIGLHPSDHEQLMDTLRSMRDQGNTVIVVEHDEDTILDADYVIDIGPMGGSEGGNLVYSGDVSGLLECTNSLTASALRERKSRNIKIKNSNKNFDYIELNGLTKNNLKNISVSIPKGALSVVVGVSGAGKSSLVHGSLYPSLLETFEGANERKKVSEKHWQSVSGVDDLSRLIEIDQSSIGKTSASTPASFLGVFNLIRDIFAELPEARIRGCTPSYFSYNKGDGRCSSCEGKGYINIPMSFLPDAKTICEECKGLRYTEDARRILLNNLSIADVLQLTISEAYDFFRSFSRVKNCLEYAKNLGIGYIKLGQPSFTLSGGEAQRLKISKELGSKDARNTLYILDEPTIGLHMVDVDKLSSVLHSIVSKGNTTVVIEHNMDLILAADYIIELGPKPGNAGGELLFQGSLNDFIKSRKKTPTLEQLRKYLKR